MNPWKAFTLLDDSIVTIATDHTILNTTKMEEIKKSEEYLSTIIFKKGIERDLIISIINQARKDILEVAKIKMKSTSDIKKLDDLIKEIE